MQLSKLATNPANARLNNTNKQIAVAIRPPSEWTQDSLDLRSEPSPSLSRPRFTPLQPQPEPAPPKVKWAAQLPMAAAMLGCAYCGLGALGILLGGDLPNNCLVTLGEAAMGVARNVAVSTGSAGLGIATALTLAATGASVVFSGLRAVGAGIDKLTAGG